MHYSTHMNNLCDKEESMYMHSAFLVALAIPVIYSRTTPTCFKVTLISPYTAVDTMPNITVESWDTNRDCNLLLFLLNVNICTTIQIAGWLKPELAGEPKAQKPMQFWTSSRSLATNTILRLSCQTNNTVKPCGRWLQLLACCLLLCPWGKHTKNNIIYIVQICVSSWVMTFPCSFMHLSFDSTNL